jgi:hypothetical protein
MLKTIINKYKARKLEAKVTEMKQQQEVNYANYALKLRMEKMMSQPAPSQMAA